MIYGYVRVSTDMQTIENQKHEIESRGWKIDKWIEETISGKVDYKKRKLNKLLKMVKKGDTIVCSEISRLGRSLFMVIDIVSKILKKEVSLFTIKENFNFDDSINSKVTLFAFGLSAEIERNLISQRTKEALDLRKAMGIHIGRPKGAKNKHHSLERKEKQIMRMVKEGKSLNYIKKKCHTHLDTLKTFLSLKGLDNYRRG